MSHAHSVLPDINIQDCPVCFEVMDSKLGRNPIVLQEGQTYCANCINALPLPRRNPFTRTPLTAQDLVRPNLFARDAIPLLQSMRLQIQAERKTHDQQQEESLAAIKELKAQLERFNPKLLAQAQAQNAQLDEELKRVSTVAQRTHQENEELRELVVSLHENNNCLKAQIATLRDKLVALRQKAIELKRTLEHELVRAREACELLTAQNTQLRAQNVELAARVSVEAKKTHQAEERATTLERELKRAREEAAQQHVSAQHTQQQMAEEIRRLRTENERLRGENKDHHQSLSSASQQAPVLQLDQGEHKAPRRSKLLQRLSCSPYLQPLAHSVSQPFGLGERKNSLSHIDLKHNSGLFLQSGRRHALSTTSTLDLRLKPTKDLISQIIKKALPGLLQVPRSSSVFSISLNVRLFANMQKEITDLTKHLKGETRLRLATFVRNTLTQSLRDRGYDDQIDGLAEAIASTRELSLSLRR